MFKYIDCPRCHGDWYMDIEPETGNPYTCFTCGNTGRVKDIEMHINDQYLEYSEMMANECPLSPEELELDAWMTAEENKWLAEQAADQDAIHYGMQ